MNHMLIDDPSAPWNDDFNHLFVCDACYETLNIYEVGDPCVIAGRILCDHCASDLTSLRFDGVLPEVSKKTAQIVHEHNKELYYRAYDNINFNQS